MVDFPKLSAKPKGQNDVRHSDTTQDTTQNEKKSERKPRVVLTNGAIFAAEHIQKSATEPNKDGGHHHLCSVGDTVMLTDAEFETHRAGGVAIVDQEQREAA